MEKMISVSELEPGMRLAKDVYTNNWIPLLRTNTVLDRHKILRLQELEIEFVVIFNETEQQISNKAELKQNTATRQFIQVYQHSLKVVRKLVEDVRLGKNINAQELKNSAGHMLENIMNNSNVLVGLNIVRNKDEYTYTHSVNVAMLATIIGKWLNLSQKNIFNLACTGLLHDIGKAHIDDAILNKPGKLTDEEYNLIKEHTTKGFTILNNETPFEGGVILASLCHHERHDGTGYPLGLKGEETHLYARIVAVADIYDAMTSNRIYRSKVSPFKVVEEIILEKFGSLDPEICQVFHNKIADLYMGSKVTLSDGSSGEVVYISPTTPTRPIVRSNQRFINLVEEKQLEIVDVIF